MLAIEQHPSPNFTQRRDDKKPRLLILHYTDTKTTEDALQLMQNPAHNGSAHYLLGDDGRVIRMIDENMRAWHAGLSYWAGESDINSTSIGIEIQNPGHSHGYLPFPDKQMDVLRALCLSIMSRWHILPQNVLAHSDIAPGRKQDPDYLFPWEYLAGHGIGLWPQDKDLWPQENGTADANASLLSLLHDYGYNPEAPEETLVTAFQRHFEPAVFQDNGQPGQPTATTKARLLSLLQQRRL